MAYKLDKLKQASDKQINACYIWLIGFKDVYIQQVLEIKSQTPEYVWKNYKALGITGTYEQNCLNDAIKDMREEWKLRPNILVKEGKYEPEKSKSRKSKKVGSTR